MSNIPRAILVDLLIFKSSTASNFYGLYDILASVGVGWETYVTGEPPTPRFSVRIVSAESGPFKCASGVQVIHELGVEEAAGADIVSVPGISAPASEPPGRHP